MSRAVFRYVPFTVRQDPEVHPEYEAECVTGDVMACGASSGRWVAPQPVEAWMDGHVKATGHTQYRRTFTDFAAMERADAIAELGQAESPGVCDAECEIPANMVKNLGGDADSVVWCGLAPDHRGVHHAVVWDLKAGAVWVRWGDGVRELVTLPDCQHETADGTYVCPLFDGHEGPHQ